MHSRLFFFKTFSRCFSRCFKTFLKTFSFISFLSFSRRFKVFSRSFSSRQFFQDSFQGFFFNSFFHEIFLSRRFLRRYSNKEPSKVHQEPCLALKANSLPNFPSFKHQHFYWWHKQVKPILNHSYAVYLQERFKSEPRTDSRQNLPMALLS